MGKNALRWIVVTVALMIIVAIVKNDEQGHYMNSLFFAVLLFTGGMWVSRKLSDATDKKLDLIDERLKRIEFRLEGLYKN